jgi:hypothetical protein
VTDRHLLWSVVLTSSASSSFFCTMSIQLSTSDAGAGGLRGEVRDGWGVRAMDYYEYAIASIKYSSSFSTTTASLHRWISSIFALASKTQPAATRNSYIFIRNSY